MEAARAVGTQFAFLPLKSGRYHVRPDRASRIPHVTRRQSEMFQVNWEAGRPLYGGRPLGVAPRKIRKIAFASPHSLVDSSNGASVATSHLLQLLAGEGFECRAFCGPRLDAPQGVTLETVLAGGDGKGTGTNCRNGPEGASHKWCLSPFSRVLQDEDCGLRCGNVADQPGGRAAGGVQRPFQRRRLVRRGGDDGLYRSYTAFLDDYRPDVLLTYGGHPVAVSMMELAKKREHTDRLLAAQFYVFRQPALPAGGLRGGPVRVLRRYYWQKLGLACQKLPNAVDWRRVEVKDRDARYVTFVNPAGQGGLCLCQDRRAAFSAPARISPSWSWKAEVARPTSARRGLIRGGIRISGSWPTRPIRGSSTV